MAVRTLGLHVALSSPTTSGSAMLAQNTFISAVNIASISRVFAGRIHQRQCMRHPRILYEVSPVHPVLPQKVGAELITRSRQGYPLPGAPRTDPYKRSLAHAAFISDAGLHHAGLSRRTNFLFDLETGSDYKSISPARDVVKRFSSGAPRIGLRSGPASPQTSGTLPESMFAPKSFRKRVPSGDRRR